MNTGLPRMPALLVLVIAVLLFASTAKAEDALRKDFADPPFLKKSRPLWFWNGPLTAEHTRATLEACKERGYCGVGILPSPNMTPAFMTKEYLAQYRIAADEAARLGMKLCLYDEFWFPSGSAGGLIAQKYPEALGKRLDMLAVDVVGPKQVKQKIPEGTLMAAVAMEAATHERRDLAESIHNGELTWAAPQGNWKVMLFTCVRDGGAGLIDYLDPQAVERFIELTYQAYHNAFPEHFGKTIDSAFYDEPAMYHVEGGRAWTPQFNARFREKYGYDPALLYPALWLDIGPETAAARNLMFGFRGELYATGFPKVASDWCRKHHLELTGHVDQEEMVNPVGLCGDLLKAMKYQEIPAIDQVFQYGRASRAYKLISSAAVNYDRPLVLTECYGGISNMPPENLYKEAMDQFAKGINSMTPHAVWYDPAKIVFQPDLSPIDPAWGPRLKDFNAYIGRLQLLLQGGGNRADIGILYPIATLQAGYYFGPGNPYEGGVTPPEADYMAIGEMLALQVRRDFTFIHPETLSERCAAEGNEIQLANKLHPQEYKVFLLPGSKTISLASLEKIRAFFEQGGKVIATTQLPSLSAESGKDAEVCAAIRAIFGPIAETHADAPSASASSCWAAGGYDAANVLDGDLQSRWNAADGVKEPQWLQIEFSKSEKIARSVVCEAFDRATAYRIEAWDGQRWIECAKGDRLGEEKSDSFAPVTTTRVRLCIDALRSDSASISEFRLYDEQGRNAAGRPTAATANTNAQGGKAWFLPSPNPAALKTVLDEAIAVPDVRIEGVAVVQGGNLSYLHKIVQGRDVYFFANSSDKAIDAQVTLRGAMNLQWWDPHSGEIQPAETKKEAGATRVRLRLPPVRSILLVSENVSP